MKKFIKTLLLFITSITIATVAVSFITKHWIVDSMYSPKLFKLSDAITTLIVGASDMEFSVDPQIIKNSCNTASPAENYFYSYYKLKFILTSNPQINTVILGFGYPGLTRASEKDLYGSNAFTFYDRYFMLLDATGRRVVCGLNRYYLVSLAKFHFGVPIEFYKSIDLLLPLLRKNVDITTYPFWGGFQKDLNFFKKIPRQDMKETIVRHYYINNKLVQQSDVLINYLEKIVSLCNEKK